jgi:integrase/recombinase XerD
MAGGVMTELSEALAEYLALRRSLGYKLNREGVMLAQFVAFAEAESADHITTELAMAWSLLPSGANPYWWACRLTAVRGFARHQQAFDHRTEVPPRQLLCARSTRAVPYLYSETEVASLITGARQLKPDIRALTYETLIGLLSVTGMRIGEVLRLDDGDVDWDRSLLSVRDSKFDRSRLVPVEATTLAALRSYAARRDTHFPARRSQSFFVSTRGIRLVYNNVQMAFHRLVLDACIGADQPGARPRLHDFRHRFVVETMLGWHRQGLELAPLLPVLSSYVGHMSPSSTYWYMTATPELLSAAARRLEGGEVAAQ